MKLLQAFILISAFTLITACSIKTKRQQQPSDASLVSQLEQAKRDLKSGQKAKALQTLKSLSLRGQGTSVADDASILLGHVSFKERNYEAALRHYLNVVQSDYSSRRIAEARFFAARCHYFMDAFSEAQSLLEKNQDDDRVRGGLQYRTLELLYQAYLQTSNAQQALYPLNTLMGLRISPTKKAAFQNETQQILEGLKDWRLVQDIADNRRLEHVRGYAHYLLAKNYADLREFSRATEHFEEVIELLPNSDPANEAQSFLKVMEARRIVDPRTVGVVLPLSGRNSKVAYMVLRGIQLALGVFDNPRSPYRLAVVDSEGDPDIAKQAVEKLVTEDHVIAIVGSLLSKTSESISKTAHSLGVPSIALSQRLNLTQLGNSVFRNGMTSEMLVSQLVENAMNKMGLRNFAILYPNDPYGVEYANLFWDHVLARGGNITGIQAYRSNETDFKGSIKRLVGTFYIEDRIDEYKYRVKNWQKENLRLLSRKSPPEDLLPPIVDFEALFIPDGTKALAQIAPMLRYNDISEVLLLGTNLWNSKALIPRVGKLSEKTYFVDSSAPTSQELSQTLFFQHFLNTFESAPGAFEIRAYDSAALLRSVLESGATTRESVIERLNQVTNFPGVSGPITIDENREASQPISLFTVRDNAISSIHK